MPIAWREIRSGRSTLRAAGSARVAVVTIVFVLTFILAVPGLWAQASLSEIRIDQPSTDTDEYFELAGSAGTDLTGLSYLVIGDGAGGSGVIEAVVDLAGTAIPASGFFVAAEATFTLGTADLTTNLNFENSDNVTHLLVDGFLGAEGDDLDTNDDGVLDVMPWSTLVDCVALVETVGSGEQIYCADTVGPDGTFVPAHSYSCTAGWEIGAFDPVGGDDTPGAANPCGVVVELSEIRIDQPGTDNDEYFELSGTPGGALDGLTYLVIGDGAAGSGVVEAVVDLTGSMIQASGLFVAAEATFTLGVADLTTNLNFENSDNVTHMLVDGFTGAEGDDLDTDDDGNLDNTPWDSMVDCIALIETVGSGDQIYCADTVGPDGTFVPAHSFACPAGWEIGAFDPAGGVDTPGSENACSAPTPVLVIHEILNNPSAVPDSAGEWFEIFNPTGSDIDIDGWVIQDNDFDSHMINNGGSLVVPAGGFVVLGNNDDPATNGGAPVDYNYGSSWFLSNGADEVVLLDTLLTEIDRVEYDGGATFPDPNGASMALIDPTLDNNVGANWCTSTTPFGEGDLGTPGAANDCLNPFNPIVINEIHADPAAGLDGDANGDGVRDSTDDEFVEIVNVTGAPVDLSDWTLSDAVGVRHVFPAGTVVADQCGIVVFGGGSPTGTFGGMVVQTASTGLLGLNNGGDTVTLNDGVSDVASVTYGGEGGDNQSLTRDPDVTGGFVKHSTATGSGGALFSPGTQVDGSQFGGCEIIIPTLEIFEIQGSGPSSPVAGMTVTTLSNVVTALATNGFFMQTPADRSDGNVDTSDGIFVFQGGAPTAAVGDLVDVTGVVAEFFNFTEFAAGSIVTVVGTGDQPPAVMFDETVPSPDPLAPSCAIEFECYESMRIDIAQGAVTGPNQRFNPDPIAEVHITAAAARTFRETGIEFPGLPGYPEWDGNPEVFELDPDKLGLPNQIIPAGSAFGARGVLGFEFGGYEMWPFELIVDESSIPVPVRAREFDEFTVGSLNLFRFFDDVDDPPSVGADGRVRDDQVVSTEEYLRRQEKFVGHILEVLDAPDILAVQEAEKLEILEALAAEITLADPDVVYTSYLIEGNDVGTIDIGFMVRESITVDDVIQLGKDETFTNPLTGLDEILHDRPPLLLQGRHLDQTLVQVFGVHMRSLGGIDGSEAARVRQKRFEQANSVAEKVQLVQDLDPEAPIIVTGDFNGFQFTDGYVDLVGQILGDYTPTDNLVCETNTCDDLVEPDLSNQLMGLPEEERYSFIFRGNAQTLDHALTSVGMEPFLRGFGFGRGNADAAVDLINDGSTILRSSDHDGLVLYLLADGDLDGVPDHLDVCPGTEIPEGVPLVRLGTNRWALVDDDFEFDTTHPTGIFLDRAGEVSNSADLVSVETRSRPSESFTTTDTAGCSCEQIVDNLDLGSGHLKFGCSTGIMRTWVKAVTP